MRDKLGSGRVASVISNKFQPLFASEDATTTVDLAFDQREETKEYLQWSDQEASRQTALQLMYNQAGASSSSTAIVPVAPQQDEGGTSGSMPPLLQLPDAADDADAEPAAEPDVMDTSASLAVGVGDVTGFETDDELSDVSDDGLHMEELLFMKAANGISAAEKGRLSEIDADSMSMILSMYDTGHLRAPIDIRGHAVRPVPLPELVLVA